MKTADVCRKHGISQNTFYKWKARFGGMNVSDARRLKTLEDENAKLKRLLAETMLDNTVLKDLLGSTDDAPVATRRGSQGDVEIRPLWTAKERRSALECCGAAGGTIDRTFPLRKSTRRLTLPISKSPLQRSRNCSRKCWFRQTSGRSRCQSQMGPKIGH